MIDTNRKMKFFCNNCAKYCFTRPDQAVGKNWRCCSMECYKEIELRHAEANIHRARSEHEQ
jgi:hypothetical protein